MSPTMNRIKKQACKDTCRKEFTGVNSYMPLMYSDVVYSLNLPFVAEGNRHRSTSNSMNFHP